MIQPLNKRERAFIGIYICVLSVGLFGVNFWPVFDYRLYHLDERVEDRVSYSLIIIGDNYYRPLRRVPWTHARLTNFLLTHALNEGFHEEKIQRYFEQFKAAAREQCRSCKTLAIRKKFFEREGSEYVVKESLIYKLNL